MAQFEALAQSSFVQESMMKRSVFPAVFAALIVSVFIQLVAMGLKDDGRGDFLQRAEKAEAKVESMTDQVDILIRDLDKLKRQQSGRRFSGVRPGAPEPGSSAENGESPSAGSSLLALNVDAEGRPLASDGTPYLSKAQFDAALKEALAEHGLVASRPFEPAKELAEVAADMGLSSGEEAQIRTIMRESEDEFLDIFFPGQKLEDIRRTAAELKADPDKQADLVQALIMRAVPNAGKLMTMENRRNRKVKGVLGEERGATFIGKRVKPIYGDEVQDLLKDVFDN
jgi:hypothetical protein